MSRPTFGGFNHSNLFTYYFVNVSILSYDNQFYLFDTSKYNYCHNYSPYPLILHIRVQVFLPPPFLVVYDLLGICLTTFTLPLGPVPVTKFLEDSTSILRNLGLSRNDVLDTLEVLNDVQRLGVKRDITELIYSITHNLVSGV